MEHSTQWRARPSSPMVVTALASGDTGLTAPEGLRSEIYRGQTRAPMMAGLTPEGDRPLGVGLAAVALMAGFIGLSSGWFGAPPLPASGVARSTQALLVDPLPRLRQPPGREATATQPSGVPPTLPQTAVPRILQASAPAR